MDITRILPGNVHPIERAVRVGAGLALLSLVVFGPRTPWGLLGLILLLSGLIGSCPIYTLLGISTCPRRSAKS